MSKKTESYVHKEKKRKNNPEVGLSVYDKVLPRKSKYDYDPHLDPQLIWTNKSEKTSFEVPIVSLLTQEKINPKQIINKYLKETKYQSTLDHFFDKKIPLDKKIEFYQHDIDWTNRLILGDSLLIMNSLLNKEGMAGKIQMIYIDPPYGIKYNSNFQVDIGSKDVKDGQDNSLTREPEQIKAFRDTWELGVHSYLSYLRDRLLLSRTLLSETGSIFVQIGIENVHYVRILLDEIFGKKNFCTTICFKKTGSTTGKILSTVNDFILWYARNKDSMKYNQLFKKKELDYETLKYYSKLELPDGTRRNLFMEEKKNPKSIPEGSRIFKTISLHSQHYSETRTVPFEYNGKIYNPPSNRQWSVSLEGMENLTKKDRIYDKGKSILYIYYLDDFPINPISNMWTDTRGEMKMQYTVQTTEKVIERCMLMTTTPGDIVLDPTCGSGTAAVVAEKWGRRWITCDTSRVAINISKQRLITRFYKYYKLKKNGRIFDFIYSIHPHISVSHEAYDTEPDYEILYDDPEIDKSIIRVSGPFTYETISSSQIMISIEESLREESEEVMDAKNFIEKVLFYLKHDGLSYPNNRKLKLKNIQSYNKNFLHGCALTENGKEETVAISIGPEFGDVGLSQVEQAIYSALHAQFNWLICIGFNFDEAAQIKLTHNKPDPKQLNCVMALLNPDIEIEDLQKKPSGVQMFTVFGEPEIKLSKVDEKYQIELVAIDTYNPQTGEIESFTPEKINVWFVDENFDEQTFLIHQMIFPNPNKQTKRIKKKLENLTDSSKIEYLIGIKSIPFEAGSNKKTAIKIIDYRGNEILSVIDLN